MLDVHNRQYLKKKIGEFAADIKKKKNCVFVLYIETKSVSDPYIKKKKRVH